MISEKIQALFEFINYLDKNKGEYIEKYIPLCDELNNLDIQRSKLKPRSNYIDKQLYDKLQKEITEKFQPITENVRIPLLSKLKELKIWSGDDVFTSIWNNNSSAIFDFKESFSSQDIAEVVAFKQKYLNFRKETNTDFLCLQYVFNNLDEIFKELFDFFKDTDENEFEVFEAKTIKINSFKDVAKGLIDTNGKNIRFSIPHENLFDYQNVKLHGHQLFNIKNEFVMGHKIQVGDITNNSGQIIIGNDIKLSHSLNSKNETTSRILKLIELIRKEPNIDDKEKQLLITNFDKVEKEVLEEKPSKSKIFQYLSHTKEVLEKLVLSHEVTQAAEWVYINLNFI